MSGVFGNPWLYNPSDDFFSHTIDQSLRFNDGDSSYLTFTPSSSTAGTWTVSFWVKRGDTSLTQYIYYSGAVNARGGFYFLSDGRFGVSPFNSSGANANLFSEPLFRDTGSWYHIVMTANAITPTNLSTNLNIYVNGVEISHTKTQLSSPTGGDRINDAQAKRIGSLTPSGGQYFDGYLAEWHWIDGIVYDQNNFGEFKEGMWTAKEVTGISYGAAGYYLNFADSSDIGNNALTTDGTNDWTPSGLVASDVISDSPTSNFATFMPMENIALSEGNLKMTTSRTGNWDGTIGSFSVTSGKWYYEVRVSKTTDSTFRCVAGWQGNQALQTVTYSGRGASGSPYGTLFDNYLVNVFTTSFYKDGGTDGTMTAASSGDVINVAADFDNGKIYFGINGTYYANDGGTDGDPAGGTNESLSGIDLTASEYVPAFHIRSDNSTGGNQMIVNFGQEGTFVNTETAGGNSDANGQGNFFNPVPSGFLALVASNLPNVTIGPTGDSLSTDNFSTVLFTGNGGTNAITVGFRPDWVWVKSRNNAQGHLLTDSVRGATKRLQSDSPAKEDTSTGVASFDSDGFTMGSSYNQTSYNQVSWNWKAGGDAPTKTYKVVVDNDGANKYRFRNSANSATFATYAPTIELQEGGTYVFDWSDDGTNGAVSAQGHPIRFSTTSNGTHGGGTEYTTGVVKDDSAYTTTITVAVGAPTLYYYCQYHSGMGGQVNTNSTFGSSNFDGSIQSVVSANQDAGFSIVTYTGGGTTTVGHGLGKVPATYIVKCTSHDATNWRVYHVGIASDAETDYITLDSPASAADLNFWNDTAPTSDVFSVYNYDDTGTAGRTYVAYCFHSIEGYSKFSSFQGDATNYPNGTFVSTGFRPALVVVKASSTNSHWIVTDNKRESSFNGDTDRLYWNISAIETAYASNRNVELFSNGFMVHGNSASDNANRMNESARYIYLAFAEAPFKFANAR